MIAALLAAILSLFSPAFSPPPDPPRSVEQVANFEQFFRAIAEQESSNNYGAVGPVVRGNRAYGKYQVMDFNIPSWTKKHYGKSLTPQQFLNNHAAQEAVARGVLKGYWDKYGARGAASAWYSGNPNLHNSTRSQSGGPSIKAYVDSVLSKAETMSGAGGTTSSNFMGTSGGNVVPALDSQELAEQYGFASSFLNSIPELKKLFEQAVSGGWSKDKFQAKLRDTTWFKSTSADERKYLLEISADPASAQQRWDLTNAKVRQLANKLGVIETEFVWQKIHEATRNMIYKGWDESAVRYFMGQFVGDHTTFTEGEAGEVWDQLRQYSYAMGVELSPDWYRGKIQNVVRGISTIQDFKSEIAALAKANFPQWTAQIDGGQTVADIAQPYMQTMAQILELPAGSVNLFDNTIKKALTYTNEKTLEKGAKPLWQFENELRSDPRWKQTKNAQDSLMQVGHKVLADFGLAY